MSPGSEHRPPTELGRALLTAARGEDPPASSRERALELVDAAPLAAPAKPRLRRRWLLGALPAAALLLGVLFVRAKLRDEPTAPVAEPRATVRAADAPAATASAVPIARPSPAASATASASASAVASAEPPPTAVAAKGTGPAATRTAGPAATAKPPAGGGGACGCAAGDLMCFMRCSQKK
jgi:hypothetical protein